MTAQLALAVTVAGGLGSLARYALAVTLTRPSATWPWATFAVNVVGAAVIGLVVAVCAARADGDRLRVVLATGFLGGFTTFSTLALETVTLVEARAWLAAISYVALTSIIGIAACAAGLALGRAVAS
jgi:CrcB protein